MQQSLERHILRANSKSFYAASKLFPTSIRSDVERLYSFLRVADDYVDCAPAKAQKFWALRTSWDAAMADPLFDTTPEPVDTVDQRVIKNIVYLLRTYSFDPAWIVSFWSSMQADLDGATYQTLDDVMVYMHGSAEVVGLMMARIMGLPPKADHCAKLQGRAFQWINFIRDLQEDNALGRQYFPLEDLKKFGLKDLSKQTARANTTAFESFMRYEIARYHEWQTPAHDGLRYIPCLLHPGLVAATRLYGWTADQIAQDPLVVFERKVKPTRLQFLAAAARSFMA